MNDLPCKDCVTLPTCIKKPLKELEKKCILINKFINNKSGEFIIGDYYVKRRKLCERRLVMFNSNPYLTFE